MSKYKAKKVEIDGKRFDSAFEGSVYLLLKSIEGLKIHSRQDKVYLSKANILYKPDFTCQFNDTFFFVEAKGMVTPVWGIKKRLYKAYGYDPLVIITARKVEVIIPDNCACDESRLPTQLLHGRVSSKSSISKARGSKLGEARSRLRTSGRKPSLVRRRR